MANYSDSSSVDNQCRAFLHNSQTQKQAVEVEYIFHLVRELNLDRKGLYKSLAPDGNPSFKTVFKLLDLLGLRLKVEPKSA